MAKYVILCNSVPLLSTASPPPTLEPIVQNQTKIQGQICASVYEWEVRPSIPLCTWCWCDLCETQPILQTLLSTFKKWRKFPQLWTLLQSGKKVKAPTRDPSMLRWVSKVILRKASAWIVQFNRRCRNRELVIKLVNVLEEGCTVDYFV